MKTADFHFRVECLKPSSATLPTLQSHEHYRRLFAVGKEKWALFKKPGGDAIFVVHVLSAQLYSAGGETGGRR